MSLKSTVSLIFPLHLLVKIILLLAVSSCRTVELERCRKAPSFYSCWFFMKEAGCGHSLGVAARKPDIFSLDLQGFKSPQDLQKYRRCVTGSLVADE